MSDIRKLCQKTYQDFIKREESIPPELKLALKAHERVPLFLDNLAREFSSKNIKVGRDEIIRAVEDLTKLFIGGVQYKAEERLMSPLKLAVLKHEVDRKKEMQRLSEALDEQGEIYVTQDKAGNETTRQVVKIED